MKLATTTTVTVLAIVGLLCAGVRADDRARLAELLAPAVAQGGAVTIPPGDYRLDGNPPLPIPSRTTVFAYGARFHLPDQLGDKARVVLFEGADVQHFAWHGGEFFGHVFDPQRQENPWEPNANTRIFAISTTATGTTGDICFRDVQSHDVAGAVINVTGLGKEGSQSEVVNFAQRVVVENCTLLRSGKFMWDYGYLWQQVVWPEDYQPWEVERAWRYFRSDHVREPVRMADGDDRVQFDNRQRTIPMGTSDKPQTVCFFGGPLPRNIVRGQQYFVLHSGREGLKVSPRPDGQPLRFEGPSGEGVKLAYALRSICNGLYAPTGCGPGKGAVDLVACRDIRVTGCRLSALGDTMHIQRSHGVVFANNQILGSRMGAFFLAEFCKNATVTGNTVDGTNGSRVMSVEKSCEDVTIVGNTFRNGGRGSWINQPRNFILANNIFVNNTTKGEADPRRGRRSYQADGWERYPELYFTIYQDDGHYGPVIVRDNIFVVSPSCADDAVTFATNGHGLQVSGNTFLGRLAVIRVEPGCTGVEVGNNPGSQLQNQSTKEEE